MAAVPAYLKCKVVAIMEHGDHPLFLAEVKNAVVQKTLEPLPKIKCITMLSPHEYKNLFSESSWKDIS